MSQKRFVSYLRIHRRKMGLSQRELGRAVGYGTGDTVRRHEQAVHIPPLWVALAYQAIFKVPVSELFPGLYREVEREMEARLGDMERDLEAKSAHDRDGKLTARKLEALWRRRTIREA